MEPIEEEGEVRTAQGGLGVACRSLLMISAGYDSVGRKGRVEAEASRSSAVEILR